MQYILTGVVVVLVVFRLIQLILDKILQYKIEVIIGGVILIFTAVLLWVLRGEGPFTDHKE